MGSAMGVGGREYGLIVEGAGDGGFGGTGLVGGEDEGALSMRSRCLMDMA